MTTHKQVDLLKDVQVMDLAILDLQNKHDRVLDIVEALNKQIHNLRELIKVQNRDLQNHKSMGDHHESI